MWTIPLGYLLIKLLQLTNENKIIKLECHNLVTPNKWIGPGTESVAAYIKKEWKPDIGCLFMEEHSTNWTLPNWIWSTLYSAASLQEIPRTEEQNELNQG